ncbi:MAG: hypothetical protein WC716_06430 [Chitinophagaceae bacterium]|jgi:hypothetical protein
MNRKIFISIFSVIISCFCSEKIIAQTTVSVKTDAQQITVGDQLRYFITATVDTTKAQLRWVNLPDTFNTLELVEKGKIDTSRNGAIVTLKQKLLITGFDSGSFLIPRFSFLSVNKSGIVDSLFTDSFRLLVNTVPVDTTKPFKAIKGVAEVETSWMDNLPLIIALLVGIGLIVWIALYFAKNKKLAQQKREVAREETFHERTLRLLNELDAKQLWQQDKPKDYYTELSEIVRQYIEIRFQTNAMELTTDELLRKAKKHREMAAFSKSLRPLLEAADLAKFAKANPLPEEHIEALELARNFVQVSKPKEQPVINNTTPVQTRKK